MEADVTTQLPIALSKSLQPFFIFNQVVKICVSKATEQAVINAAQEFTVWVLHCTS